ncbi:MAG: hypothetical protein U0929_04665 [Planctomycetaceae bacterium]
MSVLYRIVSGCAHLSGLLMFSCGLWMVECPSRVYAQTPPTSTEIKGTWTDGDPEKTLADVHLLGAATLLGKGQVIAAGGLDRKSLGFKATNRAELYDPATQKWSATGSMKVARWALDAITLPDGKALFAGGSAAFSPAAALDTAEVYDPATGKFTLTKNKLSAGRQSLGLSLLKDGRVLLTGGNPTGNNLNGSGVRAVDIYDPATDEFHAAASLNEGRALHAQLTLKDGRVVVIGGAQTSSEIYDPQKDTWTLLADKLPTTLKDMKAFELADGQIFIAGGQDTIQGTTTDASWYLEPNTGKLTPGPSMQGFNYSPKGPQVGVSDYSAYDIFPEGHRWHGRFLFFAGGEHDPIDGPDVEYNSASIYDAVQKKFLNIGPMPYIHDDHTEARLPVNAAGNPEFLLFGGNSSSGTSRFELDVSSIQD